MESSSFNSFENSANQDLQKKRRLTLDWLLNVFNSWLHNRQENYGNWNDIRKIQEDLLTLDHETPNYSLGALLTEIRKENGEEYRGNTLYEIKVAIQHYFRENGRYVTLMDDT